MLKYASKQAEREKVGRVSKGEGYYIVSETLKVDGVIEQEDSIDDKFFNCHNYYTNKYQAYAVAKYLKSTRLFVNKAIEFAQGYKWDNQSCNYNVYFDGECFAIAWNRAVKIPTAIYMMEHQAKKFADWCNVNKEALGYE